MGPYVAEEALLVLKRFGWRPLLAVGGVPVAGVSAPSGFEPYSPEERVAIDELTALGWTCVNPEWERAGHRASYVVPPDRDFEKLFSDVRGEGV